MSDTTLPGSMSQPEIENLMAERRTFPPAGRIHSAGKRHTGPLRRGERDYVAFWERLARSC